MKKLKPEDLNLNVRRVESYMDSNSNVGKQEETANEKECVTADTCDTNSACLTKMMTNCSLCPGTKNCYETWECQTLTCNDTKTSGEICCDKTHGADGCVTLICSTLQCGLPTSDNSCTSGVSCVKTFDCQETEGIECGPIYPSTDLC